MKLSDKELIDELVQFIGPTLTAFTAHSTVRAEFVLDRWREGSTALHPGKRERLELAYELLNDVAESNSADIARAWFIGANTSPGSDDETNLVSPAEAIRHGKFDEARTSAKRFINDEWS